MKRVYIYALMAASVLFATSCQNIEQEGVGTGADSEEIAPYVQGELMVKFTPEVADIIENTGLTRSGATRSGIVTVDEVLDVIGSYRLERVFPVDVETEARTRESGLHQWYIVGFDAEQKVEDVARRLSNLGEVQSVDLNRTIKRAYDGKVIPLSKERLEAMSAAKTRATAAANDECLPLQWNLINQGDMFINENGVKSVAGADVQVEGAWERSMGDPSVIVAVLDEGVYINHPDLKDHIWVNEDETTNMDKDADGNGYKGDIHGYNFVNNSGKITWNDLYDSGHGTHVAGVISAVNNNGIGVSSIAGGDGSKNGVRIMVCQIFSGNYASSLLATIKAIKYAADNGAVVLQCSWGYVSGAANVYDWGEQGFANQEQWEAGSPLEKDVLDYFTHHAGSPNGAIEGGVAVFAGGNESAAAAGFPGAAKEYVSVAATAADFTPAVYTNYGPGTTISAPGGDQDYYWDYKDDSNPHDDNYGAQGCILSTVPYHISESGYGYMEGTSMATPHVSAVMALGISYATQLRKHFTAQELQDLMHENVTSIEEYMKGTKTYHRYVADLGPMRPMQIRLADYKGKMGSGQVNADKFLAAIAGEDAGRDMQFPNVYVAKQGSAAFVPSRYFKQGENLTYTVTIDNESVATCSKDEDKLVFKGVAVGTTTATISASNGEKQSFNITVRNQTGNNGWLR